jgi:hypothetical protein
VVEDLSREQPMSIAEPATTARPDRGDTDHPGGSVELTLEELTELALAGDPDAPLADDAVPLTAHHADGPLPAWYMPAATARSRGRTGVAVTIVIIAALLLIVASGLCITYGQLTVA